MAVFLIPEPSATTSVGKLPWASRAVKHWVFLDHCHTRKQHSGDSEKHSRHLPLLNPLLKIIPEEQNFISVDVILFVCYCYTYGAQSIKYKITQT